MRTFCKRIILLSAILVVSCSQNYKVSKTEALGHIHETDIGEPDFKLQEAYRYGDSCNVNLEHQCSFDILLEVGSSSRATCVAKVKPASGSTISCMPESVRNNLVLAGIIVIVSRTEENKYLISITTSSGASRIQEVNTLNDLNLGGVNEALGTL